MRFTETPLGGAWVMDLDPHLDERGSFARIFCDAEFGAMGLCTVWPQMNLSQNHRRGILRGMHHQFSPWGETKVVRCVRGSVFDVVVDLRPGSVTLHHWCGVELSAANGRALYIPEGFAHGYQVLGDDSELLYLMSQRFKPEAARGFRWNDPTVGISWPLPDPILSQRDASLPFLEPAP